MAESTKDCMRKDVKFLGNMLAESSRAIVSGMVDVINKHDYAYMGFQNRWQYNAPTIPSLDQMLQSHRTNRSSGPHAETYETLEQPIETVQSTL